MEEGFLVLFASSFSVCITFHLARRQKNPHKNDLRGIVYLGSGLSRAVEDGIPSFIFA